MSHVPAWKRLGLELKRSQLQDVANVAHTKKRKASKGVLNEFGDESQNISPRSESVKNTKTQKTVEKSKVAENLSATDDTKSLPRSSSAKPKKVSFSADTKDQADPSVPLPVVDDYYYTDPAIKERKEAKRQKRELRRQPKVEQAVSTRKSAHSSTTTPGSNQPYLTYLDEFSKGTSWKFNKTLQTKLLENIFSIPSEYNEALSKYIEGLRGQSARRRLREDSQKIVSETKKTTSYDETGHRDSDMDDPDHRDHAVAEAMERDQNKVKQLIRQSEEAREELSEAWKRKVAKRDRAKQILLALAAYDVEQANSDMRAQASREVETPTTEQYKSRSRGRKRKLQTGVPDDDDISSDSSSSDSSSEGASEESAEDERSEYDKDDA